MNENGKYEGMHAGHAPSLLRQIQEAGGQRAEALAALGRADRALRELTPYARAAGATVEEIADAYGVSRPNVYALMKGSEDNG